MRRFGLIVLLGLGCGESGGSGKSGSGSGSGDAETGDEGSPAFREIELDGGFGLATELAFIPGSSQFLLLAKSGLIAHYALDGDETVRLGEFSIPVHSDLDCGLLSIAFDPAFETNGFFYVGACRAQQYSAIYRLSWQNGEYAAIPGTATTIIDLGDDDAPRPWHNIGSIGFDDTGAMWALFGDKKVSSNGQDLSEGLSSLVRLIPNREPVGEGYEPAPDNPFVDDPERSPLIYAYGLRSPWKGILDSKGRYWFGDVGSNDWEEVNLVTAPGQNFGWARSEGPCEEDCDGLVDPLMAYPHESAHRYALDDEDVSPTQARVVYVGLEYVVRGDDPYNGRLENKVLFGDYCQGYVRTAEVDDDGNLISDEHLAHLQLAAGWDQGPDGYIYVTTFSKCETPNLDEDDPPASKFYRLVYE